MKYFITFSTLTLVIAACSCRSQRTMENTVYVHDTITVTCATQQSTVRTDSSSLSTDMATHVVHTVLDTTGRVQSVTRITQLRHDKKGAISNTVYHSIDSISTTSAHTSHAQKKEVSKPPKSPKIFFLLFLVFPVIYFCYRKFSSKSTS